MDAKLKYLFVLSFFALMVSSCASDEPGDTRAKGSEMKFEVSGETRASVTSDINTIGSKFLVFGDRKSVEGNSGPVPVFHTTEVEYTSEGWCYKDIQYWFPNHEHSFVAIYPSTVAKTDFLRYSDSKLSFAYAIPADENNNIDKTNVTDIITATHRRLFQPEDVVNTISFRFSHLLSLINIAPALDDNYMDNDEFFLFHKLDISGFKTKGIFHILPAPRQSNIQTSDYVIDVTDLEREGRLTVNFTQPVKVENNRENIKLFDDNDAVIMLPQDFTTDSNAKFVLTYSINNESSRHQVIIPFKNKKWDSGKSYTYKFTINRTGLLFESTSITNWDVVSAGNVNAH